MHSASLDQLGFCLSRLPRTRRSLPPRITPACEHLGKYVYSSRMIMHLRHTNGPRMVTPMRFG